MVPMKIPLDQEFCLETSSNQIKSTPVPPVVSKLFVDPIEKWWKTCHLGWFFIPNWMANHKIPWFQNTNQTEIFCWTNPSERCSSGRPDLNQLEGRRPHLFANVDGHLPSEPLLLPFLNGEIRAGDSPTNGLLGGWRTSLKNGVNGLGMTSHMKWKIIHSCLKPSTNGKNMDKLPDIHRLNVKISGNPLLFSPCFPGAFSPCILRSSHWLLPKNWFESNVLQTKRTSPNHDRYMVYNGYYKVMSNIPKMGHLTTTAQHVRLVDFPTLFHWALSGNWLIPLKKSMVSWLAKFSDHGLFVQFSWPTEVSSSSSELSKEYSAAASRTWQNGGNTGAIGAPWPSQKAAHEGRSQTAKGLELLQKDLLAIRKPPKVSSKKIQLLYRMGPPSDVNVGL